MPKLHLFILLMGIGFFTVSHAADKNQLIEKIVKTAKTKKVEPALALAIADLESKFNPKAQKYEPKLKTYSVGLFQVLFTTARLEFAFRGSKDQLLDPDTNIGMGIEYLTRCIETKGPKLKDIACCYNAGFNAKAAFCDQHKGVQVYLAKLKQRVEYWKQESVLID